jgi:trk system potassium uptake protein
MKIVILGAGPVGSPPGQPQLGGPVTTFAVLTDVRTWVCSFVTLLGRLELFTLLIVLTPALWRK